jgi:hypothetical protein
MICKPAAAQTAALCTAELNGGQEVMLMGYSLGSKAIWSEVIDSHDGATTSAGTYPRDTLRLSSVSATSNGKTPIVLDAIAFAKDRSTWSDIGTSSTDGKTVASWNLTWKRVA